MSLSNHIEQTVDIISSDPSSFKALFARKNLFNRCLRKNEKNILVLIIHYFFMKITCGFKQQMQGRKFVELVFFQNKKTTISST